MKIEFRENNIIISTPWYATYVDDIFVDGSYSIDKEQGLKLFEQIRDKIKTEKLTSTNVLQTVEI